MYVSLETLRRAVGLVDDLAELDDPAGFAGIVLPGLATLVGCDVLTYNEIRPVPSTRRPSRPSRRTCTSIPWSTTTVPPAAESR
jgi:hypothetical protein